ncbi:MAG: HTH-type transcriptional regulator RutR, partial [Variovorax sp.]
MPKTTGGAAAARGGAAGKPATKPSQRALAKRAPGTRSPAAVSRRLRQIEDKRSVILAAALGLFSRFG